MQVQEVITQSNIFSPIQLKLIKTLQNLGPIERRELVEILDAPRTTIYDNLVKLQTRKVVEKFTKNNGERGRPIVYWKIK